MPRDRKSPSSNQNWIKEANISEWKKSALKTLEKAKEIEDSGKYAYVKISDTPRTFKRIKIE